MLSNVIIGGGLSGLVLANNLHAQGIDFALYEARERLGGRILTVPGDTPEASQDLGPTWFWPDSQPRMVQLVEALGLQHFPQHDTGTVLRQVDADKKAEDFEWKNLHGGARRVAGGMGAVVDALASRLPRETLHLNQQLVAVRDRGDHVELVFHRGELTTLVLARQVVLAIPPRLLDEHVQFEPELDNATRRVMRDTPTWMAGQAKAIVRYPRPFWRESGESGNAFVEHPQAVLGEIYDSCDASGGNSALGGFFALPPQFRSSIDASILPLLLPSQMAQVFGPDAELGEPLWQDWAGEPFTCATADLEPLTTHPQYDAPELRVPFWQGKLFLTAAETGSFSGGYMEGALDAVARTEQALALGRSSLRPTEAAPPAAGDNDACLACFSTCVARLRSSTLERYRQQIHGLLSTQDKSMLTQRALLGALEQIYAEALQQLDALPFDSAMAGMEKGRSNLMPGVLEPFDGFIMALLDEAVVFNRGSCALSNFPAEHKPSREYVDTIVRDLAAAWRDFALQANTLLLNKDKHMAALS